MCSELLYLLLDGEVADANSPRLPRGKNLFHRSPNLREMVVIADHDLAIGVAGERLVV